MNREQVMVALEGGAVVRHETFPKKYNIKQSGENYEWETGALMNIDVFWKTRQSELFNKGWSINDN